MCRRHFETLVVTPTHDINWLEKPPNFRRNHVVGSRTFSERRTQTSLGEAQPVVRSSVEVANAQFPCRIDRRSSLVIADDPMEVPKLRAAQRKLAQQHSRAADGVRRDRRRQLVWRS